MALALYSHNEQAYNAALAMLSEHGKAAVIHPTGTGKSFIGFKLCEDHPAQTICWLSPSEYIFKTQIENLKTAANGWAPQNIRFITYAKLMLLSEAELAQICPDYIILDEFHRCGAQSWGAGVERLLRMYPQTPILGLSATAVRYLDNQRDMAGELFDGNVASEMTLGDAIVRGILQSPKYVMSVFAYEKDFEHLKRRVRRAKNKAVRDQAEEYLQALRRALEKSDGLDTVFEKHITDRTGKYLVFCSNLEHLREMRKTAKPWFSRIDTHPHIYTAYSDDPTASKAFAAFKSDNSKHLKLLFCIDMLNEGIHVEGVSGVILLRPTESPIVYKQQIGRALATSQTCVPVIFDIVNNIESLYSIGTIQQEMEIAVNYYRFLGESQYIVNEQFHVIDEVREAKELFEKLNDTLTASWDTMFQYAKAYYDAHGDLLVPHRYKTADGYSLGNWIFTQRKVYAGEQYGKLDASRIKRLEEIGMVWENTSDLLWKRYAEQAVLYRKEHGDLLVPAQFVAKNGVRLGHWIADLRSYRRSGIRGAYLTPARIRELDRLGMVWEVNDYLWEENFAACLQYYRTHDDLHIPADYVSKDGLKIGAWLLRQKQIRKGKIAGASISEEQIRRLNAIGMGWLSKSEQAFEALVEASARYFQTYGDLMVPATYVDGSGYPLGKRIGYYRNKYALGRLSDEQIARLDTVGMIWETENPWEKKYKLVEAYYSAHGDLNIPCNLVVEGVWLNKWLNEQKQAYLGKRRGLYLTPERVSRLSALGMDWGRAG